jgi:hypothetical protein
LILSLLFSTAGGAGKAPLQILFPFTVYENALFWADFDDLVSSPMISGYSRVRAVIDTDTFNEVDDQFALRIFSYKASHHWSTTDRFPPGVHRALDLAALSDGKWRQRSLL